MGWYGIFLVKKLKIACSLRRVDESALFDDFDLLDKFFEKYDKMREDIEYIEESAEESKSFSAKATARMFNVIDALSFLPEVSDAVFLLYFLHKHGFEIEHFSEENVDLEKLEKKGWKVIRAG